MNVARDKAWETRRAKYGARGHASNYSRAAGALGRRALALVLRLHDEAVLSEGQCCKALDLDRVTFREIRDVHSEADATDRQTEPRESPENPIREQIVEKLLPYFLNRKALHECADQILALLVLIGGDQVNSSSVAGSSSSQEGSDTQDIRQDGKED